MRIEMSLQRLLFLDPECVKYLPADLDLTDPDYIVRIDTVRKICEIGYHSDKEWILK